MEVDGAKPFLMAKATWPEKPETLSPPTGLVVTLPEDLAVSMDEPSADADRITYVVTETAQDHPQYFCYTVSAYRGDLVSPPATSQDMCITIPANPDQTRTVYVSWVDPDDYTVDGYRVQYYQGFVATGEYPEYGDAKLQLIGVQEKEGLVP